MKAEIGGFILAAGLGSRLKPWTDHHPKALAIINGKSLLQRNVEYLQSHGIFNVVVNVHHFADQIIEAVEKNKGWGSTIQISDESDLVLETGGGLLKAKDLLKNYQTFVLMNCDILTNLDLKSLIQEHKTKQATATLAVAQRDTSRYLLFNQVNEMIGWKNVKTGEIKMPAASKQGSTEPQALAFSGIHVISQEIFQKTKLTGKFSMIDLYLEICAHSTIRAFNHSQDTVLDVGKPEAIAQAEALFA